MKNVKRIIAGCIAAFALTAMSVTTLAATNYSTPAEVVAGVTGKTTQEVIAEREAGKSYGTIAAEAGKLTEFHQEMLNIRQDVLNERVQAGMLTRQQADQLLTALETRQTVCDGTGIGCDGTNCGAGYGAGHGTGHMSGHGGAHNRGVGNGYCRNRI